MTAQVVDRINTAVELEQSDLPALRHDGNACAFEQVGDPRPKRFALTGEVMGKALGLVISWSGGGRQLLR